MFQHYRLFKVFDSSDNKPLSRGGVTVYYEVPKEGNIRFSVAICSSKDNFCYKKGRLVAEEKYRWHTANPNKRKGSLKVFEIHAPSKDLANNELWKAVNCLAKQYIKSLKNSDISLLRYSRTNKA